MTITATQPHPIYLAGRWVDSPDPLEVSNPADPEHPAGSTYHATPEQYDEAVDAAVRAFEITRQLPAYERGRALREISAGIKARREELGRLMSLEAGKPIRDALLEVDRATLTFRLGGFGPPGVFPAPHLLVSLGLSYDNNHAMLLRPGVTYRLR